MTKRIIVSDIFSESEYFAFVEYCHNCNVIYLDEVTTVHLVEFKYKNNLAPGAFKQIKVMIKKYENGQKKNIEILLPPKKFWDEAETIFLVNLYSYTKYMKKAKSELYVAAFIEMLEAIAVCRGLTVNENYCTIAGVKLKLEQIHNWMTTREEGFIDDTKTEIEKRILDLFMTNNELYLLKLQKAKKYLGSVLYFTEVKKVERLNAKDETISKDKNNRFVHSNEREVDPVGNLNMFTDKANSSNKGDLLAHHLPADLSEDDSIEVLNLPVCSQKALMNADIDNVGSMVKAKKDELYKINDLSAKSIKEILGYQIAIRKHLSLEKKVNWFSNVDSDKQANTKTKFVILHDYIVTGALDQDKINSMGEECKKMLNRIHLAREILGEKLTCEFYSHPEKAKEMQSILSDIVARFDRITKMQEAYKLIPGSRLGKPLHKYLLSFRSGKNRNFLIDLDDALSPLNNVGEIPEIFDAISSNDDSTNSLLCLLEFLTVDVCKLMRSVFDSINKEATDNRIVYVIKQRCKKMKLQEIAEELGLTRERVRQLEAKGKNLLIKSIVNMKIDLFMFISAEQNGANVMATDEIRNYMGDMIEVELFFYLAQRDCIGTTFSYCKNMDAYCYKDASKVLDRVKSVVKMLPNMVEQENIDEILHSSIHSQELPIKLLKKEFENNYEHSGNIYYRGKLFLSQVYDYVMCHHYPTGIKLYDRNELRRFRKIVAEVFGDIELPTDNRAIEIRIADISILCARGAYIHSNYVIIEQSLLDEISAYINNSTRVVFSFNELYKKFQSRLLLESNVNNRYFLQGVLKHYHGDNFIFTRDTISQRVGA